ncbi:MAG TPA: VapC toxin family PIN domain ribonuclease [Rhodocyclaceae bacterium]
MAVNAALVDAGPLIALFDSTDKLHQDMTAFFRGFVGRMHTTWPVVTEVCHFLSVRQQRAFLAWLRRGGAHLDEIDAAGLDAFDIMLEKYADQPMDLADASLVWLGAKLKLSDIITIDRNDFSIYRTPGGKPFRNLLTLA